jgi:hypothetical protein
MTRFLRLAGIAGRARTRVPTIPLMASSRHRLRNKQWPLVGFGAVGAAIAAALVALAVGITQAAGGRACAAVLSAAGPAAQSTAAAVSGTATHYVLQGLPNCSYPSPPANGLFVAMPPGEYASAAGCGGYLEVHGPDGSVRVEVIDQCPDCGSGHIDLSETAFAAIAPLNAGLINVTYQDLVNPPLPGPLSVRVKEGSSRYWLALLAMNTGNPLASVQVESAPGGGWHDLARASYNYWVAPSGAGAGPFTVRLTDTGGNVVTVRGITLSPGAVQDTGAWMYGAGTTAVPASPPATTVPTTTGSAGTPSPSRGSATTPAGTSRPAAPRRPAVLAPASSPAARISSPRPATPRGC